MSNNIEFVTASYANRIECAKNDLVQLYLDNGHEADAENLLAELNQGKNEDRIRVVFIGQYTAGKSTIISALTGNSNILIDADVATSESADYYWGNVVLTDTPGLYTENPEHDQRAIEMIRQSDLLIYCITSDLFNPYTLQDFKQWAFEVGYAGKMFLIVNKMSKEAGTYDDLKTNYSKTLNLALQPHSVAEIPCSFVDAKDYKDGVNEADRELIEYSHFEEFIEQLNSFISRKGILGKLDTPIMIMKASIDEVSQMVIDDDSNRAYEALLSRIEKKINQQKKQVSLDVRNTIRRSLKNISDKGYEISRKIGVEDVNYTKEDINELIEQTCEDLNQKLVELSQSSLEQLNEEITTVLNSPAAEFFFNSIGSNYTEKGQLFENKKNKITRAQFDSIKDIVETITGSTLKLTSAGGKNSAQFFLKAADASGSKMHKAILYIGEHLGVKFKPWQAANVAKGLGNLAKVLGPVMSVIGLIIDVNQIINETAKADKIEKAQLENRQIFIDIATELERQYSEELTGLFDIYDDVTAQLQDNRIKVQKLIGHENELTDSLAEIRANLVSIQTQIL